MVQSVLLLLILTILHVQGQPEGFLRLVDLAGNTGGSSGRLEIFHEGQWGTICDDVFEEDEATVACRQLGYSYSLGSVGFGNVQTLGYPEGSLIWLNGATCSGLELRLDQCHSDEFGVHSCQQFEDIVLFCNTIPVNGAMRLVDGAQVGDFNDGVSRGRLDVYFSGEWGGVCDSTFGALEAIVACRQLGYNGYTSTGPVSTLGFSAGGNPLFDTVDCLGTEPRLIDCPYNGPGFQDCTGRAEIGLVCDTSASSQPIVRLVGITGHTRGAAGRLEVLFNDEWMTVRNDNLGSESSLDTAADIVCDQLGYSTYFYHGGSQDFGYPQGTSSNVLSVLCRARESSIQDCSLSISPSNSFRDDLVVFCSGAPKSSLTSITLDQDGDLRLNVSNGGNKDVRTYSGRLELFFDSKWGTVCSFGFSESVADRVCQELGYKSALYFGTAEDLGFGEGSGPIWVEDIRCDTADTSVRFLDCTGVEDRDDICPHSQDMGLVCIGEGSLRFSADRGEDAHIHTDTGRLEVYANSRWGTVCDDNFEDTDAHLACKQLGFLFADGHRDVSGASSDFDESLPINLDNVDCFGVPVSFLLRCINIGIGNHNCRHNEDVHLTCENGDNTALAVAVSLGLGIPFLIIAIVVCLCCLCCCTSSSTKQRPTPATGSYPMQQRATTTTAYVSTTQTGQQYPAAYPQQPTGAYPKQPTGAYPQQPTGAYPQQPTGAYPQQPTGAYPQQPTGAYPQQLTGAYPQQPTGAYPKQQYTTVYPGAPPLQATSTQYPQASLSTPAQPPPAAYHPASQQAPPSYDEVQKQPL